MTLRYCLILFFAASLVAGTPPQKHPNKQPRQSAEKRGFYS